MYRSLQLYANTIGFDQYIVYVVQKSRPSARFSMEYSALTEWECQD